MKDKYLLYGLSSPKYINKVKAIGNVIIIVNIQLGGAYLVNQLHCKYGADFLVKIEHPKGNKSKE